MVQHLLVIAYEAPYVLCVVVCDMSDIVIPLHIF